MDESSGVHDRDIESIYLTRYRKPSYEHSRNYETVCAPHRAGSLEPSVVYYIFFLRLVARKPFATFDLTPQEFANLRKTFIIVNH